MRWLFRGLEKAQGNLARRLAKLDTIRRVPLANDNYAERRERLEEKRFARRTFATLLIVERQLRTRQG
mgnify:CR=1 FL=1